MWITHRGRGAQQLKETPLRGDIIPGIPVDFSHGDVNENAFAPTPGAFEEFVAGVKRGGDVAYTEYRGSKVIREGVAARLADFTGKPISADSEVIISPGTQGSLFLAMGATVGRGDKVAIVQPDYFANRKLVEFFDGEIVPVQMDYFNERGEAGLDLSQLESAFKAAPNYFCFPTPTILPALFIRPPKFAPLPNWHKNTALA